MRLPTIRELEANVPFKISVIASLAIAAFLAGLLGIGHAQDSTATWHGPQIATWNDLVKQPDSGDLNRAEEMTKDEQTRLEEARDKVRKAKDDLAKVQATIAGNHKMSRESYMEWSSWYVFDNKYILFYWHSNMRANR